MNEHVGALVLVGVTFVMFAGVLSMFAAWGPPVGGDVPEQADPWTYCEGHEFQKPACDGDAPMFSERAGVLEWCRPVQTRELVGHALVPRVVVLCVETTGAPE